MRVLAQSPVEDKNSYEHKWDTVARSFFNHFETHRTAAIRGTQRLMTGFLTKFRDPIQYDHRLHAIDHITLRQYLGEITKQEVKEVNQVIYPEGRRKFFRSRAEPALLESYHMPSLIGLWLFGASLAGYALVVKKYNILWTIAPFVPIWTTFFYQWMRQPTTDVENAYKYILAKRAATCEMEKNQKKFANSKWMKAKEHEALQSYLKRNNTTLYELEAELVSGAMSGRFR